MLPNSSVSHRRSIARRCGIAAAAAAAALVILPNTSASVAYAMSQVPVLSRLVEVVTFRDYHYEDDRNSADIQVPEVTVAPDTDADTQKSSAVYRTDEENSRGNQYRDSGHHRPPDRRIRRK